MNHTQLNKSFRFLLPVVVLALLTLACSISIPSETFDLPTLTEEPVQVQPQEPASQPELLPTADLGPTPTPLPVPQEIVDEEMLMTNLYLRIHPSVVNISIYGTQGGQVIPVSQGSGFVYDTVGHIVTNAHVVHGAEEVEVIFSDDTVRSAEIVGEDLNSDLAVIRVELPQGVGPLPMADMGALAVGQTVIAVGNPFGLEGTLTRGVISALGRSIPALTPFTIPQAIQTDAAINPGNSGGPLLNLQGEVIGVNAQIETGGTSRANSGVGFAIPISIVQRVVPDLVANGVHQWAWLGVRGGSLTAALVEAMNLPVERGAYIAAVEPGGPADDAGLQGANDQTNMNGRVVEVGGDVVTAVNGEPISSFEDMLVYVALRGDPGQELTLTIVRDGQTQDVPITLGERPDTLQQDEFTIP